MRLINCDAIAHLQQGRQQPNQGLQQSLPVLLLGLVHFVVSTVTCEDSSVLNAPNR